jgi:hypothetical protein
LTLHWVINGRKKFITGAEGAKVGIVMAKSDNGACMFLVDLPDPAIRTLRMLDTIDISMPGGHAEIEIENLRVSADQMLGTAGDGFKYAQIRLSPARLSHCTRWLGLAIRANEIATDYACRRHAFGKPLVSEALMRVADRCVQVMGGTGVSTETIVEQAFREIRAFRTYDGPTEVHKWSLAKKIKRDWKAGRHKQQRERNSARGFPGGSCLWRRSARRLDPNSRGSAGFRLLDLESVCLSHKVAQLAGAIGSRIEIGSQVGKPFSDLPEANPPVFAFHLGDDLLDHWDGRVRGLKQRRLRGGILSVRRAAQQVLGIDESAAGLPEAFRRLLLAEPEHIDAVLADAGGKPGKIAV